MSQNNTILDLAFKATTDISSYQNQLVIPDTTQGEPYVSVHATANGISIGVLQNKPTADGEIAQVRVQGTAKIKTDATCGYGVPVFGSSNGKIYTGASNGYIIGIAMEAAASTDCVIECLLAIGSYLK